MRLNTKGRFAVSAMIDLALRAGHGPVPLAGIGRRQQISLSYLEQLFGRLRRNGLVSSTRGPGGGYSLGRDAARISVADIVAAVDEGEDADLRSGQAPGACRRDGGLMTGDLWAGLDAKMLEYLAAVSLKTLADEQIAKGVNVEDAPAHPSMAIAPMVRPLRVTGPNSIFALGAALVSPAAEDGTPASWRNGRGLAFAGPRRGR